MRFGQLISYRTNRPRKSLACWTNGSPTVPGSDSKLDVTANIDSAFRPLVEDLTFTDLDIVREEDL